MRYPCSDEGGRYSRYRWSLASTQTVPSASVQGCPSSTAVEEGDALRSCTAQTALRSLHCAPISTQGKLRGYSRDIYTQEVLKGYPLSGDGVKTDPEEVLGSYVCPTVERTNMLANLGIGGGGVLLAPYAPHVAFGVCVRIQLTLSLCSRSAFFNALRVCFSDTNDLARALLSPSALPLDSLSLSLSLSVVLSFSLSSFSLAYSLSLSLSRSLAFSLSLARFDALSIALSPMPLPFLALPIAHRFVGT